MLKLKELWRQCVAGLVAGAAFTGVYLALNLVWWLALLIGLAVYGAALLLIERAPEDNEIYVYGNVTQFDIQAAVKQCEQAATQFRKASRARTLDADTALAIERLAQLVEAIGRNYLVDGRDLKHSRSFITHYLPNMSTVVADYLSLSERTVSHTAQQRLQQVGNTIRDYVPHVQSIYDACLENDFEKLELETAVLGDVLRITQSAT